MQALSEAVRQGKARYIGFSEWSAPQIEDASTIAGVERLVSSQPQYSLLWRQPEKAVFPLCAAKRSLANRLVAPGPGRVDRQVSARRKGTDPAGRQRSHGTIHPVLAEAGS